MAGLSITLLGGLTVKLHGRALTTFKSRKTEALLVYLACGVRPCSRDELAAFLWDDSDPAQAQANLRKTLSELRQYLDEFLLVDRQTIALNPTDVWLDVAEFEALTGPKADRSQSPVSFERAIELYKGDFLAGFFLRDSYAFDEWAALARERLRLTAVTTLETLATHYLHHRHYARGILHATQLLAMDPLHEASHRLLMRLLARSGQRSAALAQYASCQQILEAELGVAPQRETTAVYQRIRHAPTQPSHFPTHFTPFIGRQHELVQISQQLDQPGCRLLTLLGLGGVGKTRLALQAAADLTSDYEHGVYFLSLAGTQPDFFITTVNSLLGVPATSQPARQQLLEFLLPKQCLLVLDNFEHLLAHTAVLHDILRAAAHVQLLVTSRERLNLPQETVLELPGLAWPNGDVRPDEALVYDAVQLFVKQAQRVYPDFNLSQENVAGVIHICRLVEGLPLGIELAAAASHAFSPTQIAAQIQQNLDFLSSRARDLPPRHRSIRAMFHHSWQMLSPGEQQVFSQLSVCRNGFDAAAARAITAEGTAVLHALLGKSLLRQPTADRYDMHELARQFAAESLQQAGLETETRQRHGAHFCAYVRAQEVALNGVDVRHGLAQLAAELENIHAAWEWAVTQGEAELLATAVTGLSLYYLYQGPFAVGVLLMQQAIDALAEQVAPIARLKLHLALSSLQNRLGSYDDALAAAHNALSHATAQTDPADLVAVHLQIGLAHWHKSEHQTAHDHLVDTLALAQRYSLTQLEAEIHTSLGLVHYYLGDFAAAAACYDAALPLHRQSGNRPGEGRTLHNIAIIHHHQDDIAQAIAHYQQGLTISQEVQDQQRIASGYLAVGNLYLMQGEYDQALKHLERAVSIRHHMGDRQWEWEQIYLAAAQHQMGDLATAAQTYRQTIMAMQAQAAPRKEGWALAGLALLQLHQGEAATAVQNSDRALVLALPHDPYIEGAALTAKGQGLLALGRLDEATAVYERLLALRRQWGEGTRTNDALAGLAAVACRQGDVRTALHHVEPILEFLKHNELDTAEDPAFIYRTCVHILQAAGDGRAHQVLEQAREFLHGRAASLHDPDDRQRFLTAVAAHRALSGDEVRGVG
ncbi:MAG TPA: tetratricopeptide repeat protein [Chloroflexota bacterium]|nr:tetratricopeptide repeat protein [Chloroflexota bacterium]